MYRRILIPTDGSALSTVAAHAGVDFAKSFQAEIIGLHVVPEYTYPLAADAIPPLYISESDYTASSRTTAEYILKQLQDAATNAGLQFTGVVEFADSPARQIVKAAEQYECDLIFMGSHGRGGLGQLLLGSVATKVLSLSEIPVMVFKLKKSREPATSG